MSNYYRPTRGEDIGYWNVFPRTGGVVPNVPFDELPEEVKEMIRDYNRKIITVL